ncbi:hypothetical protein IWZ01DRAFT_241554 [Phyllosticta capitalensis]
MDGYKILCCCLFVFSSLCTYSNLRCSRHRILIEHILQTGAAHSFGGPRDFGSGQPKRKVLLRCGCGLLVSILLLSLLPLAHFWSLLSRCKVNHLVASRTERWCKGFKALPHDETDCWATYNVIPALIDITYPCASSNSSRPFLIQRTRKFPPFSRHSVIQHETKYRNHHLTPTKTCDMPGWPFDSFSRETGRF